MDDTFNITTDKLYAAEAYAIQLSDEVNNPTVTIKRDGSVVIREDLTIDEAAQAFWDAVRSIVEPWRRETEALKRIAAARDLNPLEAQRIAREALS